jgi:hypothetical protein
MTTQPSVISNEERDLTPGFATKEKAPHGGGDFDAAILKLVA